MSNKLAVLTSRLLTHPRAQELRREAVRKVRGWSPDEVEKECLDFLHGRTGTTCVFDFQVREPDGDRVEAMTKFSIFYINIIYLEILASDWLASEPSRERQKYVETLVDLWLRIADKREQPIAAVENDLVAAYFICAALWNERRERPLLETAREDVFTRNELHAPLADMTSVGEIVHEVRRRCGLNHPPSHVGLG